MNPIRLKPLGERNMRRVLIALAAFAVAGAAQAQEYSVDELTRAAKAAIAADDNGPSRSLVLEGASGARLIHGPMSSAPKAPGGAAGGGNWKAMATFRTLQFGLNSDSLTPDSAKSLNAVAEMIGKPDFQGRRFKLVGNTDASGSTVYNRKLSTRRAKTAVDYLVLQGVSPDRLDLEGWGEDQLLAGVDPMDARHRRVELYISGQ
jgi:outer membrane protein OmpA-like peptidoglycan-associated protein